MPQHHDENTSEGFAEKSLARYFLEAVTMKCILYHTVEVKSGIGKCAVNLTSY